MQHSYTKKPQDAKLDLIHYYSIDPKDLSPKYQFKVFLSMIIRSFYSGHPKKGTDLNKVWAPLGTHPEESHVINIIGDGKP